VESKNNQKDGKKRLWIAAGIAVGFCLLSLMAGFGRRAKGFIETPSDGDITISVGESVQEKDGISSSQEEDGGEKQQEDSQNKGKFFLGVQGIVKGSVAMARRGIAVALAEDKEAATYPKLPETLPPPEQTKDQEPGPPVIYLVSDLHYMSAASTDYQKAFETFEAKSDGKVIRYLPQVLDALLEEAIRDRPDALVLTGDITMNGERINHQELAQILARVQEAGIQVLVIPGNHDINNPDAAVYFGEKAQKADAVDPREFEDIYRCFGPDQAISRDEGSFSYVYALRDDVWLMLLDTAQYEPRNLVEGAVRPGTLLWMEENLKAAKAGDIQVVVLGHHNLLSESRMFTTMCTLENGEAVTGLLEHYQVPLYISGHLHLQRTNQHKKGPGDTGYGIYEIVSDAVSIPPCQYGILTWQDNKDMNYCTRRTDVEAWAAGRGEEDENLLRFVSYGQEYIRKIVEDQIKREAKQVREKTAGEMAEIYADVYADYCAGVEIDERERMRSREYRQWEDYWPQSKQAQGLRAMIGDCSRDYNAIYVPGRP